jgi:pyruvate kinase
MHNVAVEVESDPNYRDIMQASRVVNRVSTADAIVSAAREIAETVDIKAICCFTQSGKTAALVARERPRVPILALTPLVGVARRMCLTWGIACVMTEEQTPLQGRVVSAARAARAAATPRRGPDHRGRGRALQRAGLDEHPARGALRRAPDLRHRPRNERAASGA